MALRLVLGLLVALFVVAGVQPGRANAAVTPHAAAACHAVAELQDHRPHMQAAFNIEMLDSDPDSSAQFDGIEAGVFALAADFAELPSIVWVERFRAILIGPDPYPPRSLAP
jgi:hypothetical protein